VATHDHPLAKGLAGPGSCPRYGIVYVENPKAGSVSATVHAAEFKDENEDEEI
jgi:hypothetical protein